MEWAGDWKYFLEILKITFFNDNIPIVDCPIDF